ncbi:hypothetical protein EC988_005108 [Linderina pennispora]|nr:hypothetical protein EC988_005108 [Linderina pennispora]
MSGETQQLFVGRLPRTMRSEELRELFERFGEMSRCDVKRGSNLSYGFIAFKAAADGKAALEELNGKEIQGENIVVEFAKGPARNRDDGACFRCGRPDCPDARSSRRGERSRSPRRSRDRHRRERRSDRRRSRSRSGTRRHGRTRDDERSNRHRRARRDSRSPGRRRGQAGSGKKYKDRDAMPDWEDKKPAKTADSGYSPERTSAGNWGV